jgi:uncharacterized protein (DUF4415 family)
VRDKKPEKIQVGMKLDVEVVEYFKKLAEDSGLSYQGMINFALRHCIKSGFKIASREDKSGEDESGKESV